MAAKVHKEKQFPPIARESEPKNATVDQRKGQQVDAMQLQWMRLNSLFQNNTEGMAMTDDFGNILMANQSFCKILQKSQAEVLEMRVQDILPLKGLQEITAKAHLQAISRQGHYVIGTKIRERRYLGVRHVVMEEGKDQHHLLLYLSELTEKVREQAKQAEKEEMLLQVLENSQEPFLLLDTALTITAFNTIGANLLYQNSGRKAEKGASMLDYGKSERQKEKSWKLFREVLSGLIVEREMKFVPPGTAFQSTYKITYLPFFDAEGGIYGIYISGRDITNRLTDAQTIAEKEVFQEVLQRGAHGAMLILTPSLTIRYATPAVHRLLGYTANEMTGQNLTEYLPAKQLTELQRYWQTLSHDALSEIEGTLVFQASEARLKQLRYTVYDYQQVPAVQGYVLQLSDATDLQQREREIQLLQRVLERKAFFKANAVLVFNDAGKVLHVFAPEIFQTQFPALVRAESSLGGCLQSLGKQPAPSYKRLKAGQLMSFESEVMSEAGIVRLLNVHAEQYTLGDTSVVYMLFLGDGNVALEIERLAKNSAAASRKLDLITNQHQKLLSLFGHLHDIIGLLPWVYELDRQEFRFDSALKQAVLLERKAKRGLVLKVDAVHPADIVLFDSLKIAQKSSKPQQFEVRMLNADGLYQPYLHWATYHSASRTWEGMWLALPSAEFSKGNPFLDLQGIWANLGFGIVQITRFGLEMQYANDLAIELLGLPTSAVGLPIEGIGVLKETSFSKACQKLVLLEEGMQLDYYHAPTGFWLHLHLYINVSHITVLMSK